MRADPFDPSQLPLAGIRVLDASHVLAGPFATYQLALLGADVIRVERIDGGDFVRHHGGTEDMKAVGLGASFVSQNACKRSIALDLKNQRGVEVFKQLAADSDIVMENFRPGVMDRLGLGFNDLKAGCPGLIYCSLSGYGHEGPLANAPAYDHILQGFSGMMAMTGTPESGAMRVGFPIVDYIAGLTAAFAIVSALHKKKAGAAAQHVRVSMLDSMVSMMAAYAVDHETTGNLRGLEGNLAFSNSPFSDRFETLDGQLVVTANTGAQVTRLCAELDDDALSACQNEAIKVGEYSAENAARIRERLISVFRLKTAEHWENVLTSADVPAAKVRTLAETLDHPQLARSGLYRPVNLPETGDNVCVPSLAFTSTAFADRSPEPPPVAGRDTVTILRDAGYSQEMIEDLLINQIAASSGKNSGSLCRTHTNQAG